MDGGHSLVLLALPLVGDRLTLVGNPVPLVGDPVPVASHPVPFVHDPFTLTQDYLTGRFRYRGTRHLLRARFQDPQY